MFEGGSKTIATPNFEIASGLPSCSVAASPLGDESLLPSSDAGASRTATGGCPAPGRQTGGQAGGCGTAAGFDSMACRDGEGRGPAHAVRDPSGPRRPNLCVEDAAALRRNA